MGALKVCKESKLDTFIELSEAIQGVENGSFHGRMIFLGDKEIEVNSAIRWLCFRYLFTRPWRMGDYKFSFDKAIVKIESIEKSWLTGLVIAITQLFTKSIIGEFHPIPVRIAGCRHRYIVARGPQQHNSEDFWKMIWEQKASIIVNLAEPAARKVEKKPEYWPTETNALMSLGDGTIIKWIKETKVNGSPTKKGGKIIIREFRVQHGFETRVIKQLNYQGGPDCGVSNAGLFDRLQDIVDREFDVWHGSIAVHSSAGMGLLVVFIGAHAMRDKIRRELLRGKPISKISYNVSALIWEMRKQRLGMMPGKFQVRELSASIRRFLKGRALKEYIEDIVFSYHIEDKQTMMELLNEKLSGFDLVGRKVIEKLALDAYFQRVAFALHGLIREGENDYMFEAPSDLIVIQKFLIKNFPERRFTTDQISEKLFKGRGVIKQRRKFDQDVQAVGHESDQDIKVMRLAKPGVLFLS